MSEEDGDDELFDETAQESIRLEAAWRYRARRGDVERTEKELDERLRMHALVRDVVREREGINALREQLRAEYEAARRWRNGPRNPPPES